MSSRKRKRKNKTATGEARAPSGLRSAAAWAGISVLSIADLLGGVTARRRTARGLVCLLAMSALQLFLGVDNGLAKKKKETPRTISGRVLDEADNGISGAVVELTDLQTGKRVAIFSEDGGKYQFSDLERNHDYEVKASYKGAPSEARKASFLGEQQLILNLRIPPPQSSDK
jgi:hypothetical protein